MKGTDKVRDILRKKGSTVWTIAPEALIYEALELLAAKNIGAILVQSEGEIVGIFSERDYARKVVLQGKSSRQLRVREVMTSPVEAVTPEHSVDECMKVMTEKRLRHLPVLESQALMGLVSIGDLVSWIIDSQEETIHQLENYIMGKYPG